MAGCDFVVSGESFDVDKYIESSSFRDVAKLYRRGDPTGTRLRPASKNSGFRVEIFEFSGLRVETALASASVFISQYRDELARLRIWPGIDQMEISILLAWFEDTAILPFDIPAEFLLLAGTAGVSLSINICATQRDDAGATLALPE